MNQIKCFSKGLFLIFFVGLSFISLAQKNKKPNILYILVDQWRAQAIGYAGDKNVMTPNLDKLASKSINPVGARVLVMGLAFKENCPDVRNTHVVNILVSLSKVNAIVDVYDPWVDADEALHELGIRPIAAPQPGTYDAIIIALAHEQFKTLGAAGICAFGKSDSIIYDVKYVLRRDAVDGRL